MSTGAAKNIALMQAETINIIYDLISEPHLFNNLISKIIAFHETKSSMSGVKDALKKSAKLATQLSHETDIDLTRDIGVIVVGLDSHDKVIQTPPNFSDWIGAKYKDNKNGIGWLEIDEDVRNISHVLEVDSHAFLPVHKNLKDAFKLGNVTRLLVVHEFTLSETALKAFRQLYQLTPTELKLCNHLSKGVTLTDGADKMNIKRSTARSHLKNIFSKIGVNSQSSLVRILTQVSAASAIQEFSRQKNISLEPDWKNGLVSRQTLICQTRYATQLSYSKYGDPDGRPILFFHCGFGSRHHSRRMAEAAKNKGMLIYKFDRPGFGHSDLLPHMSMKSIAAVTEDLLDHLKIDRVDAIGFGVGGRTLIDCIQYLPGRIKTASLYSFRGVIDGYTGSIMKRLSYLIWQRPGIFMNFIKIARLHSTNGIAASHLRDYFRDSDADRTYLSDPITINQMLTEMQLSTRQDFEGSYYEHLNLKARFPDFKQKEYNIPIKFIYGSNDPFNSFEDNSSLISKIKNASTQTVSKWGQLHITHSFEDFLDEAFRTNVNNRAQHS